MKWLISKNICAASEAVRNGEKYDRTKKIPIQEQIASELAFTEDDGDDIPDEVIDAMTKEDMGKIRENLRKVIVKGE